MGKPPYVPIVVAEDIYLEDLAIHLARYVSEKDLLDFVMSLDESVADRSFTVKLRNRLTKAIEDEGGE